MYEEIAGRFPKRAPVKSHVTFVYDSDGRKELKNLRLVGSWDEQGRFCEDWRHPGLPMTRDREGLWKARLELEGDPALEWRWGVRADAPCGEQQWAVFEEQPLRFRLDREQQTVAYAPTSLSRLGAVWQDGKLSFCLWAPHALEAAVRLWDGSEDAEQGQRISMRRDGDLWRASLSGNLDPGARVYAFELVTSEGRPVVRSDPYARVRQGQQLGVGDLYLNPDTGRETHRFAPQPWLHFLRFELRRRDVETLFLVLCQQDGTPLDADRLRARLGVVGQELVEGFSGDFWHSRIEPDGRIAMVCREEAWTVVLNNPPALEGLRYHFEANDLVIQDAYSTLLEGYHRWPRFGMVSRDEFRWQHDGAPRLASGPEELVIYQLHVGSVFGSHQNLERSSFKQLIDRLDYFVDLGVTALELLPTNVFEGRRDWGYLGTNCMATSEQYGYEQEDGRWVDGSEALKRFVDAAHARGLAVFTDVVYNHIGGDHNELWEFDGKKNPWFEWNENPSVDFGRVTHQPERQKDTVDRLPETTIPSVRHTPWGPIPAYAKRRVRGFFIDHALAQVEEFHFDGIRFDFTNLIHTADGGAQSGWDMLRRIHRLFDFFHPDTVTFAEEFPQHPVVVTEPGPRATGGAGFQAMWDTEFQHRLVHDHGHPSILQQAVSGQLTQVDLFLRHLAERPGFRGPTSAVTVISNHDEVGNASRTVLVAGGAEEPWARAAARLVFGIGMFSPGIPIFFQGEESLATNAFSWGIPSTWDVGWEWLEAAEQDPRKTHHGFCREVIRLRREAVALEAGADCEVLYGHNEHSVLAFVRRRAGEELLVVAHLGREPRRGYPIATQSDRWRLLLGSDAAHFGGNGVGRAKVDDGLFDLPAAGVLLYRAR